MELKSQVLERREFYALASRVQFRLLCVQFLIVPGFYSIGDFQHFSVRLPNGLCLGQVAIVSASSRLVKDCNSSL